MIRASQHLRQVEMAGQIKTILSRSFKFDQLDTSKNLAVLAGS